MSTGLPAIRLSGPESPQLVFPFQAWTARMAKREITSLGGRWKINVVAPPPLRVLRSIEEEGGTGPCHPLSNGRDHQVVSRSCLLLLLRGVEAVASR